MIPLAAALLVFVVLWSVTFWDIKRAYTDSPIALDPEDAGGKGTFERHHKNYLEIAKLVIGLSSASIAAIALLMQDAAKNSRPPFSHLDWPLVWFAMAIIDGVLFVGLLSWRYEVYCHQAKSYTPGWYATMVALGFSLLVMLAGGYAIFAGLLLQH